MLRSMTTSELGGLMAQVRRAKANCLATPDAVAGDYPEAERAEAIVSGGRTPFPSIAGNPPLDKTRPFLDLRRLNAESADPSS